MAEIWEVLGIEATSDEALIRKAYAARLLENNPDSNPAGFKMLRAAYEAALAHRGRNQRVALRNAEPVPPAQTNGETAVMEKEVAPPTPEELERADFLRKIGAAINEKRMTDALKLYDRGLALGTLEFGQREYILNHIMSIALEDKTLGTKEFSALLEHVGWQSVPNRHEGYNPVRQRAAARAEAEAWLINVERVAYGEDKPTWERSYKPAMLIGRALYRWRERKNAALLLGSTQFFRISRSSVKSLQALMLQYEHYKPWIAHRLDEHAIARAQGILRRDAMVLGRIHRWLWPIAAILLGVFFGLLALGLIVSANPFAVFCGIIAFRLIRYGIQRLYEVGWLKI